MVEIVSDTVLVIRREGDDEFDLETTLKLSDMHNNVPGFGDRISLLLDEGGLRLMEVVGRHFLEYVEEKTNDRWLTWFVIVEEVDPPYRDNLDEWLMGYFKDEFRFPDVLHHGKPTGESILAEELDRENRDPAYWTPKRKEILRQEREARLATIRAEEERERKE
ncbi:hypothetical protein ATN84_01690 [Paramesorhizobium deserti]|uniref:Uncharacterized protein n=1 Tax=Paramesorhizobium deserti TaxID=1494590 RepID=A0A135HZ87_9HYPH|nr:hypothetical protein [Paramesorhizobium deserti]KXF78530.1 hypothetical protein ATN84_01690 [Paramesorhizobium deserti]